jgi:hypothetical protein
LLVLGGVVALCGVLVLASAALDQPSRYYRDAVVVEAPREAIWALLTEFDRYAEWNPYVIRGRGQAIEGSDVTLTFETAGGSPETQSGEILVFHPRRKLEWRTRKVVPGILDYEQIFRVLPLGPNRYRLVQEARFEGVLVPLDDFAAERAGLVAMLHAIVELAPTYQSSSP